MGRFSSFTQAAGSPFFYFEYDYLPSLVSAGWLQYVLLILQGLAFLVEHVAAWLKTAFLILPSPVFVNHGTDRNVGKEHSERCQLYFSHTRTGPGQSRQTVFMKNCAGNVFVFTEFGETGHRRMRNFWGRQKVSLTRGRASVWLTNCCPKLLQIVAGWEQSGTDICSSFSCSQMWPETKDRLLGYEWKWYVQTLWAIPCKGRNVSSLGPFSFPLAGISVSVVEQQLRWGDGCYLLRTAELCYEGAWGPWWLWRGEMPHKLRSVSERNELSCLC